MSPFPASWPVVIDPFHGTMPDHSRLRETALGETWPDASWGPLVAANMSVGPLDAASRKVYAAALAKHAPNAQGFGKQLTPAKAWDTAVASGMDLDAFAQALLLVSPGKTMATVLKKHEAHVAFAARAGHYHVEHRLTSKAVPEGLAALKSLKRFTLLSPGKLKSSANLAELAALPNPLVLTLAFDGLPDDISPAGSYFVPPKLELLAPGGFKALHFETTGSLIRLALEDLSGLASWSRLETLVLTATSFATVSAELLTHLRAKAPRLKRLIAPGLPEGVGAAWPELQLLEYHAWSRSADPWTV